MGQAPELVEEHDDPTQFRLKDWLRHRHGTRTGTFTFNGVTYTDLNEVTWRLANNEWLRPEDR
jgi:hypothetical protein